MNKTVEELKEQAQELIREQLRAAKMRQGCTDYNYYAEQLLGQLEPLIWAYAPVPERIVLALKYGNQADRYMPQAIIK